MCIHTALDQRNVCPMFAATSIALSVVLVAATSVAMSVAVIAATSVALSVVVMMGIKIRSWADIEGFLEITARVCTTVGGGSKLDVDSTRRYGLGVRSLPVDMYNLLFMVEGRQEV